MFTKPVVSARARWGVGAFKRDVRRVRIAGISITPDSIEESSNEHSKVHNSIGLKIVVSVYVCMVRCSSLRHIRSIPTAWRRISRGLHPPRNAEKIVLLGPWGVGHKVLIYQK